MKAVVFHGIGDIRLEEVKDPTIQKDTKESALLFPGHPFCFF